MVKIRKQLLQKIWNFSQYSEPGSIEEKDEFTLMIESVKKYGGFYVARYKMGVENEKMISKINYLPYATLSFDNLDNYVSTYTTSSVQSIMIYGCQLDALINYALVNNSYINQGADYNPLEQKNGLNIKYDSINNIFDLCNGYNEISTKNYVLRYRTNIKN